MASLAGDGDEMGQGNGSGNGEGWTVVRYILALELMSWWRVGLRLRKRKEFCSSVYIPLE